jgi:hypothetical protein
MPGLQSVPSFSSLPISISSTPTNPFSSLVSTRDTINLMREIINTYSHSKIINQVVDSAISKLPTNSSDRDVARAIFYWIKNHIKFEEDESILANKLGIDPTRDNGRELLIAPDVLLSMTPPSGDCDDFTDLAGAMVKNIGFKLRLVTIACDPDSIDRYSHIYPSIYLDDEKKWIGMDCSHGNWIGWEFNNGIVDGSVIFRKMEWNI